MGGCEDESGKSGWLVGIQIVGLAEDCMICMIREDELYNHHLHIDRLHM